MHTAQYRTCDTRKAPLASALARRTLTAIPLVTLVLVAGCQVTPTFTTGYHSDWLAPGRARSNAALAVRRFEDQRPPRVYTETDLWKTWIPLVPYVSLPFERLDESVRLLSKQIEEEGPGPARLARQEVAPPFEEYSYSASLARAIADDLRSTGMFSAVEYVGTNPPAGFRYELSGTVHQTPVSESFTSFGLGMPGVLLWFLALPMQKTSAVVEIDLRLADRERNEELWVGHLRGAVQRITTLYTGPVMSYGRNVSESFNLVPPPCGSQVDPHSLFSWHFEALRRAMQDAKPQIAEAIAARQ